MKCVIMAGGKGTRLWPLSRQDKPKQFQSLMSDKTMFQETYLRMRKRFAIDDVLVSTNAEYVGEVEREVLELPKGNIIAEPEARGTASSIALAVAHVAARDKDEIIALFPADHSIKNDEKLLEAIAFAERFLATHPDHIVAFGIVPTYPETGYGYIEYDKGRTMSGSERVHEVTRFVEKPTAMVAETYPASGNFLWNSGMYMFRADAMREKIRKYIPDSYTRLNRIMESVGTDRYAATLSTEYRLMDKINIEYAVIENDAQVAVVLLSGVEWSDVGSWSALKDALVTDSKQHLVRGEHIDFEGENLLVYGSKKLIVTVGMRNVIIVDTDDVTLICDQNKSQMISDVVKELEKSNKIKLL